MIPFGKQLITATNGGKTSPFYKRRYLNQEPCLSNKEIGTVDYQPHAEAAAIKKALNQGLTLKGRDIYVARFLKSGPTAMAFPCPHCLELIKEQGFKRIFFTNTKGNWEKYKC
jgi:cytidine deaminase